MIKGFKTHTVQNGIIYMNSDLCSSLLYSGEIYCNLTKRVLTMIERIEEDCLDKVVDTMKTSPMSNLYLETGQLPARFHI